jgi:hypothetical protein
MPSAAEDPNGVTISRWLLTLPGQCLLWSHYLLGIVSLADAPGVPPANKIYPEATHEIMLIALDPEGKPTPTGGRWITLTPLNFVHQLDGVSPELLVRLAEMLARALVDGHLLANPTDYVGGCDLWTQTIRQTVEHLQTGGHEPPVLT